MDDAALKVELMVDGKTGRVRQAGTVDPEGEMVWRAKEQCERDLFSFSYLVMDRTYLTPTLHGEDIQWLTTFPAYRKLWMLPRRHAKTSVVSHCLPLHILVQPPEHNIYMPGRDGRDTRILLAGEVEKRASDNLRVIRNALEGNMFFRAWWPEVTWENPRRDADKWNEAELVVPRPTDFPDPSIRAIGVGGAITGGRHDVHIKDDLVAEEAANSPTVMQTAIRWHNNSRALLDDQDRSLEFIIGTKWAVDDLYTEVKRDPTVESRVRSIVENGKPIYPEVFSMVLIERLKEAHGSMFWLLYMNSADNPELTDFLPSHFRYYHLIDDFVVPQPDQRDLALERDKEGRKIESGGFDNEGIGDDFRGRRLDTETFAEVFNRNRSAYFRARSR